MKPYTTHLPNSILIYSLALVTILLLGATVAMAQSQSVAELEINGLVIDETITKLGRDFYELFYARWNTPETSFQYTVYIREQVQPGQGTRISVLLNDNDIMSQVLQPREEMLRALASRAIQLTRYQISNYQQMAQQLESEDQSGSGIF